MTHDDLEPVAESAEAVDELDPPPEDDLLEQLAAAGAEVRRIVPECVGMSLTLREQGVTFTLVASDVQSAELDAVQYLADGPCVSAASAGQVIDFRTHQRLDWPIFAAAAEHYGVLSSLSLPLLDHGLGAGGINLYGSTPDCFEGHHEELAEILGAWAGGAVTDADLSFASRTAALQAPRILKEAATVDVAVGVLAATLGIEASQARERLAHAAGRAGLTDVVVARLVATVLSNPLET